MKIINPIYDQAFKYMLKQYLNRATQDEEMIRMLELEEDIDQEFEKLETELELARQREEEERKQKEEERKQKEAAKQREKEERKQKEEALDTITKMIKQLHKKGTPISEISAMTGKTEEEIKKILK